MSFRFFRQSPSLLACLFAVLVIVFVAPAARADELPTAERLLPQLEVILRDALAQSPRMVAANLAKLEAEQETMISSSPLYPEIGGYYQYNVQRDDRSDKAQIVESEKNFYDFGATQPLYYWGALRAGAAIGKIRAAMEANRTQDAWRLLASEIRSSYLQLIIQKRTLANVRYDAGLIRRRLALMQGRVDIGQAPTSSVMSLTLRLEDTDLALLRAERAFEQGLRRFRRLIGRDAFDGASVPDEIPAITPVDADDTDPIGAEYAQVRGFERNTRYANTASEIAIERLNQRIIKSNLRPRFDLTAGARQDEIAYSSNIANKYGVQSLFIGVILRWNIWDGFASRGRMRASLTTQRRLENQLEQTRRDLLEAVVQAGEDLDIAARSLAIAEKRFPGSIAGPGFVRGEMERGRATQEDVDVAESGANNARLGMLQTRAAYLNALAAYLSQTNADPVVQWPASSESPR